MKSFARSRYLLRRNPLSLVGVVFVLLLVLVAMAAPWLARYDPLQVDITRALKPPSRDHWMGTNDVGMDVMSRVLYGTRTDLAIASISVGLAIVIGVVIGAFSGYVGRLFDEVTMRLMESQESFPAIVLGICIAAVLGPQTRNVIIVLVIVHYPMYARLVRSQVLSMKTLQFVEAAKCNGASTARIVLRHIIPNCLGPVYVQGSLNMGWAVLLPASLSFIGLGSQMPTPEWGLEISRGARYVVSGEWWLTFFPGVAIFLTVLAFSVVGDGLQDIFDPKRR